MVNSLGFDKPEAQTRVVVAMSGGVDSSCVAAMLHAQGYEVIGITLQLYDFGVAVGKKGACCAGQDISDARKVCDTLGVPHYVLNYESKFKESVIDDFVETYLEGETPIPCVRCNQTVKFKDLLKTAHELGADCMATGHYVQRVDADGRAQLHRGADGDKDQSYFLFATTQEQLDFLRFPLGGMHKDETRSLAQQYGLAVADKPDSQDICFVPNGDYASVIRKIRPDAADPGEIMHIDGTVMGEHAGIINYTVGQRKGLRIGGTEAPLYVIKLDAAKKRVIVGPREALARTRFTIKDVNWLETAAALSQRDELYVKVRSAQPPIPARITPANDNGAHVELLQAYAGIAPGQACVFYDKNRVLGGGWIARQ
jgi:tRNA-specific 2-thiouridylase